MSRTAWSPPSRTNMACSSTSRRTRRPPRRKKRCTGACRASWVCGSSRTRCSTRKPRNAGTSKRYFTDAEYFGDAEIIRPYRVGMSCGFCHIGPHPLNPPKDIAEPEWANLSSIIGAQYWRTRAIVGNQLKSDNFIYHVLDAQPPGTIDTSLVASDNINNPNAMNAIFEVPGRLDRAGITVPGAFPLYKDRSTNKSREAERAASQIHAVDVQGRS